MAAARGCDIGGLAIRQAHSGLAGVAEISGFAKRSADDTTAGLLADPLALDARVRLPSLLRRKQRLVALD